MRLKEKLNVYESIVAEIRTMIEVGALAAGEKLPSVRAYAVERRVNPNTVAKAYAALEDAGYIVVQMKKGAFVKARGAAAKDKREEIRAQLLAWQASGVEKSVLLKEIERTYEEEKGV